MKKHSSGLFKQAISLFMAIFKAKSMAVKRKASNFKTRFIIFHLLHDKNALIGTFPRNKIESLCEEETENLDEETIVLCGDDDDDVDDDETVEEKLEDFDDDVDDDETVEEKLEDFDDDDDEVDRAADDFIRKFREEMRIEKQESFKMYEEMLARGV